MTEFRKMNNAELEKVAGGAEDNEENRRVLNDYCDLRQAPSPDERAIIGHLNAGEVVYCDGIVAIGWDDNAYMYVYSRERQEGGYVLLKYLGY